MKAEEPPTDRKVPNQFRKTFKTEKDRPKDQVYIDLQGEHWNKVNQDGQKSTEGEERHHSQRSKKGNEGLISTIYRKQLLEHRQRKTKRKKHMQQSSFEKLDLKRKIRQQEQLILYYDQLLAKEHEAQPIDIAYQTITLTFDRKIKDHIKNYCYQGNLIGKLNTKNKIIIFNQKIDLQSRVRFEMKAETCFQDNFVIVGIREGVNGAHIGDSQQMINRDDGQNFGRGVRPLRGDFIGVYFNGRQKVIEFKVNQFVIHVTRMTEQMLDKHFFPYLMMYRPGDVLRINYSLEDQFQ